MEILHGVFVLVSADVVYDDTVLANQQFAAHVPLQHKALY